MRKRLLLIPTAAAFVATGCGVTVHRVPPGQSLNVAMAKKAVAIEQPPAIRMPNPIDPTQIAVEPDLPASDTEKIADLITSANFCMQAGKPKEAIAAYEEAIQLKPDFAEARYNLAVLYQQVGEEEKALREFKRFKEVAQH